MIWERAMRRWNVLTFPSLIVLLLLLFLLSVPSFSVDFGTFESSESPLRLRPLWRSAVRSAVTRTMNETHVFIPANHPNLKVCSLFVT